MTFGFSLGLGGALETPPLIVAEVSGNHDGKIENAFRLIQAAKIAGADAVKFQTYEAHTITIDHDGPDFRPENPLWAGQSLYDLYKKAQTPFAWHEDLFSKATEVGIPAFSAPFDPSAVELLESLNAPAYKIASSELVDLGLIKCVAQTGKPMIMSTGMATLPEIDEAMNTAVRAGAKDICLLYCTAGYPTPIDQVNLGNMVRLKEEFGVSVGLSDHTIGHTAAVAAVALGAEVIEKHFYLDGHDTVDSSFSLNENDFSVLVKACRDASAAMKPAPFGPRPSEMDALRFRRSLFVVEDMQPGELFTEANVRSIRPAGGLHTRYLGDFIGRPAKEAIKRGTPLTWDMLADKE